MNDLHSWFGTNDQLAVYFALYLGVCFIVSLLELLLIPKDLKGKWMLLFLYVINASMPIAGIVITLLITTVLLYKQKKLQQQVFSKIYVYESLYEFPIIKRIFGEAFIREALENEKLPVEIRLKALVSLSTSRNLRSIGMLRTALSHEEDEIRLYSYNMISAIEKELSSRIGDSLKQLNGEKNELKWANKAAEIARLYWEMLYLELVDETLRAYFVLEAEKYASLAILKLENDPGLHLLLGRIYLYRNYYRTAHRHFIKALELKAPIIKVIPYIAEVLFMKKDYKGAGEMLTEYQDLKKDQLLNPVIALWEN